jgi:DNA-binding Lrp family transcriptional regulator
MIWSETINMDHPENLRIVTLPSENERKTHLSPVTISYEETQIDATDRQIARILSQNSRTPFRKIAEQLDISTKNVIQRYKKLRGKVLTFSAITVDLKKLGYNAMAGVFIQIENKSKIPEIYTQLLQTPNLIVAVKYVGLYDLFAIVVLRDFEDLFKLKNRIHMIHHIKKLDIFVKQPFSAWPLNMFAPLL